MKSDNPKITIGMTCYNAADTIVEAIDSAIAQDWENKEILIVNDRSSDHSIAVIEKKISGISYARLITHEKNTGFAGSLNTLIANAQGEFLAIFDDDDVSVPHRLRAQYERLVNFEKKTGDGFAVCHAARIQKFPGGMEKYIEPVGCEEGREPKGEAMARRTLIGEISPGVIGICANCSRMARLKLFRDMGGFDQTMRRAEDTDFNIRFALAGGTFLGIAEPLVIQKMTAGADKNLEAERAAQIQLYQKHGAYLRKIGWEKFSMIWIDARFADLHQDRAGLLRALAEAFVASPAKFVQKIIWSLPARQSRRDLRKWYRQAFGS